MAIHLIALHCPFLSIYVRIHPYMAVYIRMYPYRSVYVRIYPFLSVFIRIRPYVSVYDRTNYPRDAVSSGNGHVLSTNRYRTTVHVSMSSVTK